MYKAGADKTSSGKSTIAMKARHILNASASVMALAIGATAVSPALAQARQFDIDAGPAAKALNKFAQQADVSVVYTYDAVAKYKTNDVEGAYEPDDALLKMVDGTGLTVFEGEGGAFAIRAPNETADLGGYVRIAQAEEEAGMTVEPRAGEQDGARPGSITGGVTDERTGANLKGALVTIEETGQTASTDDLGNFRFPSVRPGSYTLRISYLGYRDIVAEVTVDARQRTDQSFAMTGGTGADVIVVYGSRSARAQALNQERTAENRRTVISSDLLGNSPGATISEALRRAPGISFQRDALTGEGRNVIVRGLAPDLNAVKLNELQLPVASGLGRAPDLGNMLADSIESVTISNSLLPSQDSEGTGGLIEIITRSPLSRPSRYANISIEGGKKFNNFADDFLASGTFSGKFGAQQNFGLGTSIQYRERQARSFVYSTRVNFGEHLPLEADGSLITNRSEVDPRTSFPFEPGVDGVFPANVTSTEFSADIKNLAITFSAEWSPKDSINLKFDGQRLESTTDNFSRNAGFEAFSDYVELPVASLGGEIRNALVWQQPFFSAVHSYTYEPDQKTNTNTYSVRGDITLGMFENKFILGYGDGSTKGPGNTSFSIFHGSSTLAPEMVSLAAVDPVEGRIISLFRPRDTRDFPLPMLSSEGWSFINDPSQYLASGGFREKRFGKNDRYTYEISSRYNHDGRHFKYLEAGFSFESSNFSDFVPLAAISTSLPSIDSLGLGFSNSNLADSIISTENFKFINQRDMIAFLSSIGSSSSLESIMLGEFQSHPDAEKERTEEDNLAAYFQTRIDVGKLEIIGGVRYDRVKLRAVNLRTPIVFLGDTFNRDPEFEAEFTRVFEDEAATSSLLPRVLFNYRHNDNLIVRGGYFLSVARPEIQQLSNQQLVQLVQAPFFGPENNQPLLVVSQGNPELKPAHTQNFDLGVEYYDKQIGVMKVSGFYKRIKNLLQQNITTGFDTLDGVSLPEHPYFQEDLPEDLFVRGTRPSNSPDIASIWGVEAVVERQFTFLPGALSGLGVLANYTYTDSSSVERFNWAESPVFDDDGTLIGREPVEIRLSGMSFDEQPKHSGAAVISYNKYNIDASLGYTWQARRRTFFRENNLSPYVEDVGSLDFRAEYRFGNEIGQYRVYLEAEDILRNANEPLIESTIGGDAIPIAYTGASFLGGREFRIGIASVF